MSRGPAVFPRPQDGAEVPDRGARHNTREVGVAQNENSITPYADSPKNEIWGRGQERNTSDALRPDNAPLLDCPPRSGATSDGTTKGKDVSSEPSGDAGLVPYGNARGRVARGGITRL